jgi:hypothetical protein
MTARLPILALLACGVSVCQNLEVPQDFINCIGPSDPRTTCQLGPYTYNVRSPLVVSRGVTIEGANLSVLGGNTTLQRAGDITSIPNILQVQPNVSGVTILNLTFDGNRYGSGGNCLPANSSAWDVDTCVNSAQEHCDAQSGTVTIQYARFINAPGDALRLSGSGSTVSYSSFADLGPSYATRSTAIRLFGQNSGVWVSNIYYAGTAAINVQGTSQYIIGSMRRS